jgi:hypothetical protein
MSNPTKTSLDKIKLLDQMLEDIAGDEFEDYDADEGRVGSSVKHHDVAEDLDAIETFH